VSVRARLSLAAALATATAASGLGPVFAGWGWLGPVLAGIAAVAVGSLLTQRLRLPAVVGPPLSAVLVLFACTGLFARGHAIIGVIPTAGSFATLGSLAAGGRADIRVLVAPVATDSGVVLIAVVGVALVALVVDTTAAVLRRPALAGLPLLAMLTVCDVVVRHGVGVVAFVLGAVGYLVLLGTDARDRTLRWGRLAGPERPRTLGPVGRRVGVGALAAALVLPLMLPTLHPRLIGRGSRGSNANGFGSVVTFNPLVRVASWLTQSKSRALFRVWTKHPDYLQLTTLDQFDGDAWTSSDISAAADQQVSQPLGLPYDGNALLTPPSYRGRVQIFSDFDARWLPVPYPAANVRISGDWRYDPPTGTVFSVDETTVDAHYGYSAYEVQPSLQLLEYLGPAAVGTPDLTLPSLPRALFTLTDEITKGAQTPYEKALAIQDYLRSPPFRYDTSVSPADGVDAIMAFLRSKRGFCQQYAATMAVMARIVGIPSRVAVGFTPGTQQPDGSWLVTTHDAHAWPELLFPNVGWLRFEPTPRTDGQVTLPFWAPPVAPAIRLPSGGTHPSGPSRRRSTRSFPQHLLAAPPGGFAPKHPSTAPTRQRHPGGGPPAGLLLLIVAGAAVVVGGAPAAVARWRRWWRWRAAGTPAECARAAWAQLSDDVCDLGLPWRRSDTPRTAAARLVGAVRLDEQTQAGLRRLVRAVETARYAPRPPVDATGLRADATLVGRSVRAALPWSDRLRAWLWPASSRSALSALADRRPVVRPRWVPRRAS
jgi:hypothetical protein